MEDPSSFFFQKGFSSSQSLRLCPILPHPKQKTDLITPPKVTPMACNKSFLLNSCEHEPILIQNGEEYS
ncbi:hypothetical protein V6Z12_A11G232000 [Gossypium hirsutum]